MDFFSTRDFLSLLVKYWVYKKTTNFLALSLVCRSWRNYLLEYKDMIISTYYKVSSSVLYNNIMDCKYSDDYLTYNIKLGRFIDRPIIKGLGLPDSFTRDAATYKLGNAEVYIPSLDIKVMIERVYWSQKPYHNFQLNISIVIYNINTHDREFKNLYFLRWKFDPKDTKGKSIIQLDLNGRYCYSINGSPFRNGSHILPSPNGKNLPFNYLDTRLIQAIYPVFE